jgi:hypothetical protein
MKSKLLLMLAMVAGIAQANLLDNPGFEDGAFGANVSPDYWEHFYISYSAQHVWVNDTGAHEGGKYMKMFNWIPYGSTSSAYLGQEVPGVLEEHNYSFSVWAKNGDAGQTNQAGMEVEWFSTSSVLTSGAAGYIGMDSAAVAVTGDVWTRIHFGTYTAPEGTIAAKFWLVAPIANGVNPIYYDDAIMVDPNAIAADAGIDMITWSGKGVQLAPDIFNPDSNDLDYAWSAVPDDGVSWNPSATVETPIVTITDPLNVVPIYNAGFEVPAVAPGEEAYSLANEGWGYYDNGGDIGVWDPNITSYGGNAPEGENVGWALPSDGVPGGFAQILTATLTAETTYTLTVEVGNTPGYSWGGYKVQLLAGGSSGPPEDPGYAPSVTGGTLLAEDPGDLTIAEGTFETSTVTYVYDVAHEALLGEPLQIRLLAIGPDDTYETDFDDVKLIRSGLGAGGAIYELTLAINIQGEPQTLVQDSMTIDVYPDPCLAKIGVGLREDTDLVGYDCITSLPDLAELVKTWLDDLTLEAPEHK